MRIRSRRHGRNWPKSVGFLAHKSRRSTMRLKRKCVMRWQEHSRPDDLSHRVCGRCMPKPRTTRPARIKPFQARAVKMGDAVNQALDYILSNNPEAFLAGLDVGTYGSAFKTCKGLIDRHGPQRGDRYAVGRVVDHGICVGRFAGWRAADRGVPVRRFFDGGRFAARAECRHMVFSRGSRRARCSFVCRVAAG